MTKIDWILKTAKENEENHLLQAEVPFCKEGDYDYSDTEQETIDRFLRKNFDSFSF